MSLSLRELVRHEDVREVAALRGAVGLMALHGGIEPPTYRIAREAAECTRASLYAVVQPGHRDKEGHLTSTRYDRTESRLLDAFLDRVQVVLSVHGMNRRGMNDRIALGGRNRALAAQIGRAMRRAGLEAIDDLNQIPRYLRGAHRDNPVNIPPYRGVQIEIGRDLRLDPGKVSGLTEVITVAARSQMEELAVGAGVRMDA